MRTFVNVLWVNLREASGATPEPATVHARIVCALYLPAASISSIYNMLI